jgi:hypothetical protein
MYVTMMYGTTNIKISENIPSESPQNSEPEID